MICATRRGVRRSTVAGQGKRKRPTLQSIVNGLDAIKAKHGIEGRPFGARVLTSNVSVAGISTLGFRHPTKKATAGRYAFLKARTASLNQADAKAKAKAAA